MYVLGGSAVNTPSMTGPRRFWTTLLDSVEQYNTETNKWTTVGQLTHAAHNAACVVYKMSIYVFGGRGQNHKILDRVQVFDTATKLCTELTQRLPRPQCRLRAVMWNKSVILIGLDTCLVFDLEQQTFQQRDQFAADVDHFGLALENQRIFIIGGVTVASLGLIRSHSDEVKSVAVMDIINNQTTTNWLHHATLPQPGRVRQAFASMTLASTNIMNVGEVEVCIKCGRSLEGRRLMLCAACFGRVIVAPEWPHEPHEPPFP